MLFHNFSSRRLLWKLLPVASLFSGRQSSQWVFAREPLPSPNATTRFIYVGPFLKDCTGTAPMKCLEVRDDNSQPWRLHYARIIGFEPVPGIEYRLRLKEDHVARPAADASAVVWYLDSIIEQKVVDREAAEQYHAGHP